MKKAIWSLALVAVGIQSSAAMAIYRPGWERPVLEAKMIEMDAMGHEIGIGLDKVLTMHQQDGAQHPTMLTLVEEQKVFCVRAPCPPIKQKVEFVLRKPTAAGCGSLRYFGVDKRALLFARGRVMPAGAKTIQLVDHTTRLCDDYKKYTWEAKMTDAGRGGMRVRQLFGNPTPVITIQ